MMSAKFQSLVFGDEFNPHPLDEVRANMLLNGLCEYRKIEVVLAKSLESGCVPSGYESGWKFYYHSLAWTDPLRRMYLLTQDGEYLVKLTEYLKDWIRVFGSVPSVLPSLQDPGDFSWYDMSTSLRVLVLIGCMSLDEGGESFWVREIEKHGRYLLDPSTYPGIGNHALHHCNALMSAGAVFSNAEMVSVAMDRLSSLVECSIDSEGVCMEGSSSYHLMNMYWWRETTKRLSIVRNMVPGVRDILIPDMRKFLRYLVSGDGSIVLIGDSFLGDRSLFQTIKDRYPLEFVQYLLEDSELAFSLSCGSMGIPIRERTRCFKDGYFFSLVVDEDNRRIDSHLCLRFGGGITTRVHSHDDAGMIIYYPKGNRLLESCGLYSYYGGMFREYAKSARAHSVFVGPDRKYYRSVSSTVNWIVDNDSISGCSVSVRAVEKTPWNRVLIHSKKTEFVLVQDIIGYKADCGFINWTLGDQWRVESICGSSMICSNGSAFAAVVFLGDVSHVRLSYGQFDPVRGWRSNREGEVHCIQSIEVVPCNERSKILSLFVPVSSRLEAGSVRIDSFRFSSSETRFDFFVNRCRNLVRFSVVGQVEVDSYPSPGESAQC